MNTLTELIESIRREPNYDPSSDARAILAWITRAAELPRKSTLQLAVFIRGLAMQQGYLDHLILDQKKLESLTMSHGSFHTALTDLHNARLVTAVRKKGKAPVVSIVEIPDDTFRGISNEGNNDEREIE